MAFFVFVSTLWQPASVINQNYKPSEKKSTSGMCWKQEDQGKGVEETKGRALMYRK